LPPAATSVVRLPTAAAGTQAIWLQKKAALDLSQESNASSWRGDIATELIKRGTDFDTLSSSHPEWPPEYLLDQSDRQKAGEMAKVAVRPTDKLNTCSRQVGGGASTNAGWSPAWLPAGGGGVPDLSCCSKPTMKKDCLKLLGGPVTHDTGPFLGVDGGVHDGYIAPFILFGCDKIAPQKSSSKNAPKDEKAQRPCWAAKDSHPLTKKFFAKGALLTYRYCTLKCNQNVFWQQC
jgi:hypothetical protein